MKDKLPNAFFAIACGALILLFLAFLGFALGVKVHYWNTPIGEVPTWALPFVK